MSNTVLLNFSCPPTLIELYVAEDLFLQRENGHFYFCWEKKKKKNCFPFRVEECFAPFSFHFFKVK